jgi:hypothetical protein
MLAGMLDACVCVWGGWRRERFVRPPWLLPCCVWIVVVECYVKFAATR